MDRRSGGRHQPVLLDEVIDYLVIQPNGIYIDATFGRGGHSRAILAQLNDEGRLLAIDQDPAAKQAAVAEFGQDSRFSFSAGSFADIRQMTQTQGVVGQVQGILLDLGVSSPQLDDAQRGFSFQQDGPLDMRMDTTQGVTAADWINTAKPEAIAQVLKEYGEERFARRIANAIAREREQELIITTGHLARIVAAAQPAWQKGKHPATRSFQAIRIFLNNELQALQACLEQCLDVLAVGGRLLVISFHSLEDRIVKQFIRKQVRGQIIPVGIPVKYLPPGQARLCGLGRVKPGEKEVRENPRARSAVLRIAEKLA